ncbi:carboxypeptidase-like regulatory domain-containing protein, partial [Aliivibrio kagoshimensis]|uniref:carboxypeptidase-like regulatory domain-containing protein n=1 Tax=Aliivibrio kagoshimensis TaxID=2910230 RepID=UPI003D0EE69C
MRLLLLLLSMLFSNIVYSATVSGTIFEDYNFGGTSRSYEASLGMSGLASTLIQLHRPGFTRYETTNSTGQYWFSGVPSGKYTLTIYYTSAMGNDLDGELYSARGNCEPCLPVQVYPEKTTQFSRSVTVGFWGTSGQDIGINYSTVLNNHDYGAGSLRQFLINSRFLDGNSGRIEKEDLKQDHPDLFLGFDNAIFTFGSNQTIVLHSPLDMLDTQRTSIDARRINLTLKNHRLAINEDYGIKVHSSYDNFIRGVIFDGFDDSVYLNNSSKILFGRNTFKNTRDSGITVWGNSNNNKITNNIFDN